MGIDLGSMNEEQKEFFDSHMFKREVLEYLKVSVIPNGIFTLVPIPDGYPTPYGITVVYNKKEVYAVESFNIQINETCVGHKEAIEYLGGISNSAFSNTCKKYGVQHRKKYFVNGKYYLREDIERLKSIRIDKAIMFSEEQNEFYKNHFTQREVMQYLNTNQQVLRYLTQVPIPNNYPRPYNAVNIKVVYKKEEVFAIEAHNKLIVETCIEHKEALMYLGVAGSKFRTVCKELGIDGKSKYMDLGKYWLKEDVERIKKMRETNTYANVSELTDCHKEFFKKHMTKKDVLEFLNSSNAIFDYLTKVPIPDDFPQPNDNSMINSSFMYNKEEVFKIKAHNDKLRGEGYIEHKEAMKRLNIKSHKLLMNLRNELKIEGESLIGSKGLYYSKVNFEKMMKKLDEGLQFWDEHLTANEVSELLNLDRYTLLRYLKQVPFPEGINRPSRVPNTVAYMYSKKQVNELIEHNLFVKENCMSYNDAMEYLNLSLLNWKTVMGEEKLKVYSIVGFGHSAFFLKDEINRIKGLQDKFWRKYISPIEIKDMDETNYNNLKFLFGNERHDVPVYARKKEYCYNPGASSEGYFCYERAYVLSRFDCLNQERQKREIYNTYGTTHYETFEIRMHINADELDKFNLSIYTKEKYYEYIERKLKRSTMSLKSSISHITPYMRVAVLINDALRDFEVIEVYSLTTEQLLVMYNLANITQKKVLYDFLELVEGDIKLKLSMSGISDSKVFNLTKIKPVESSEEEADEVKENEIYDFETYSKVFKYLNNIEVHVKNSVDKMFKDNNIIYPSVWLYLMLHLNNAWRNGDVADFPRLHITDLLDTFDIRGFEWFKNNRLTLSQARLIITRVIQHEFRISKTQLKGHFFSSDILAPAIATAILMMEAYLTLNDIVDTDREFIPLLDFSNKYNEPTEAQIKNFFKGMDSSDDFYFLSKKMNKSVMSYIYHLSHMSGDDSALKYIQTMRGHWEQNSTLHYLHFDLKNVEELTKHLFLRGEFGYIPALLIQKVEGAPLSFAEITEKVYEVNETFNGVFKLDFMIGFTNTIQHKVKHEWGSVARLIESKSLDEAIAILNDIFLGNLPSRQPDIQCLVSKQGCQRTDKKLCYDCEYHIPSIYALKSICMALLEDIKAYYRVSNIMMKMKHSISAYRKLSIFKEAINKFGREYVYACFGMSKEELLGQMNGIPEPEEFFELLQLKSV